MTENGKVIAVKGEQVWISVERSSACGKCSAQSGCGQGLMSKILPTQNLVFSIISQQSVKEGDEVELGLDDSAVLGASWLLYGLPLSLMLVLALVAGAVLQWSELAQVGAALFGLVLGFAGVSWYGRFGAGMQNCQPRLLSVRSAAGAELIATSQPRVLPRHAR